MFGGMKDTRYLKNGGMAPSPSQQNEEEGPCTADDGLRAETPKLLLNGATCMKNSSSRSVIAILLQQLGGRGIVHTFK